MKIFSPLDERPMPDSNNAEAWLCHANDPTYHELICTTLTDANHERKSIVQSRVHQKRSKQIHQAKINEVGDLLCPLKKNKSGTTYLHSAQTTPTAIGLTTTTLANTPTSRITGKTALSRQC